MRQTIFCLTGFLLLMTVGPFGLAQEVATPRLQPGELPPLEGKTWHDLRSGLDRSYRKFSGGGSARVAFLGGSITQNPGWQNMVADYLRKRFPQTQFDFINAGISSTGSTPGAFRLENDVLKRGKVDLLFEEAAVNDNHNGRSQTERVRGMEGIIRHAYVANPECDIIVMHFAEPAKTADYAAGKIPDVIVAHDKVTAHYHVPTLNLAREVYDRIESKQFDWAKDFKNLHPSPFGQQLYYHAIRRMLEDAWGTPENPKPVKEEIAPRPLPKVMVDPQSYTRGKFVLLSETKIDSGFQVVPNWTPPKGGGTRGGFVRVPMLSATEPGGSVTLPFTGRGVGLFVAAGPDAGILEYCIDNGEWKTLDTFTRWSRGLNIPCSTNAGSSFSVGREVARPPSSTTGFAAPVDWESSQETA